jgi:hypothetical protein
MAAAPMPASPAVRIVLDPGDTKGCAELVGGLHCLGAGRVVCHATHTGRGAGGLALELLVGLGKRFDAARTERVRGREWQLAEIWTAAERTHNLFVLRAHLLGASQWDRLIRLTGGCGTALWLIVHEARVRDRHAAALHGVADQEQLTLEEFASRWHTPSVGAVQPLQDRFPEVPSVDFPTFRAACRKLLDAASFQRVDELYNQTFSAARDWVRDHVSDWTIPSHPVHPVDSIDTDAVATLLQRLTVTSSSPSETLVRLRGAQAGLFLHGILVPLDLSAHSMIGTMDLRATLSPAMATRLRGLCTPEWTAAAALALIAEPRIGELAALDLCHIAPDAAQVTVGALRDLHVPDYARSLILAQVLQRRRQGAGMDAPLFVDKSASQRCTETALTILVGSVATKTAMGSLHRGAGFLAGPSSLGAAWLARRGLKVTRIDDPYPWLLASS